MEDQVALIRAIEEEDAQAFSQLLILFSRETRSMLLSEQESTALSSSQLERTRQLVSDPNQQVLVALQDDELIGFAALTRGAFAKNSHSCSLMVGVVSQYAGNGVGSRLMDQALAWIAEKGITRVELSALAENERALKFYARFDFVHEGIKKKALQIGDEFLDEVLLARCT